MEACKRSSLTSIVRQRRLTGSFATRVAVTRTSAMSESHNLKFSASKFEDNSSCACSTSRCFDSRRRTMEQLGSSPDGAASVSPKSRANYTGPHRSNGQARVACCFPRAGHRAPGPRGPLRSRSQSYKIKNAASNGVCAACGSSPSHRQWWREASTSDPDCRVGFSF